MTRIQLTDLNSADYLVELSKFQQKQMRGGFSDERLTSVLKNYENGVYNLTIQQNSETYQNELVFTPTDPDNSPDGLWLRFPIG